MPLIFITGISTSGKSTIAKELQNRGYEAYDTEHNGISAWFNKQTGERAAEFGEMPERTAEWLSQHHWLIDKAWVIKMADKAQDTPVFLCGGAANEPEIRMLCQKVMWIRTNEEMIRQRVNNPRDHDYGTKSHELARAIEANVQKEAEYRAYGAIMVDATQSIDQVVDEVIRLMI